MEKEDYNARVAQKKEKADESERTSIRFFALLAKNRTRAPRPRNAGRGWDMRVVRMRR